MTKTRYSEAETQRMAKAVLAAVAPHPERATVVGLSGDLGAGKTTLTQALARELGIAETLQSPTFVIAKFYPTAGGVFRELVHIDAYRIESDSELSPIGWDDILARPETLVVVEWPERIASALPAHAHRVVIEHDGDQRTISYVS
jgi:tRNA threonylcarbamoyladenosine biosynthesis protein TsaE